MAREAATAILACPCAFYLGQNNTEFSLEHDEPWSHSRARNNYGDDCGKPDAGNDEPFFFWHLPNSGNPCIRRDSLLVPDEKAVHHIPQMGAHNPVEGMVTDAPFFYPVEATRSHLSILCGGGLRKKP